MAGQQFEPMSVGQIIDQTFKLYKMNFIRFITVVAVAYVPIGLIVTIGQSLLYSNLPAKQKSGVFQAQPLQGPQYVQVNSGQSSLGKTITGGILTLVGVILYIIGYYLCSGALIKSISEVYLGNDPSVGQVYKFVLPKFGALILASILVGVVVGLGFMLLIVPGVIFSLWFWLTAQVVVVENLSATQAMGRSKALASGNLGKIFAVGFTVGLISLIISGIIQWTGGFLAIAAIGTNMMWMQVITGLFGIIASVIVLPISTAAGILLYYDLRIRKEGFDLEMLAKSMAPATEPSA